MINSDSHHQHKQSMLSFVRDLPNICSLVGLLCAVLAIYYAFLDDYFIAMIAILWAVFFDWADGIIARKMTGRTNFQRDFGAQLDSLIDIVSFGVFPAIFLLSYSNFSPWFLPGAFLIIATSAIRLSYFNVFGLVDNKSYMGLALDNNIIIFSFVFLFQGHFNDTAFSIILYALWMILLVFNIAPIRTPKFAGKWFYALLVYTLVMTFIYGWIQWY
jgi:phosphatidylserine synthase